MADRLIREGSPPSGLLASPVPQYWNPAADGGLGAYEKVQGVNGANRVLLWGSNNQPLLTETNAGYVRAADGALATIGALADAAQTSPTAEASVVALLKGVLTRLQAGADGAAPSDVVDRAARELGRISAVDGAIAALGTLADAAVTDPATSGAVIGLLKGLLQTLRTDGAQVQLSGSLVEQVDGADAIRTKQVALAYQSWDFDGQASVTVTAGAAVEEGTSHQVNGFSTLAWMLREDGSATVHKWRLRARWQSVPGGASAKRSVTSDLADHAGTDAVASEVGLTDTLSQYLFLIVNNLDTVDHSYHVHGMLRV